MQLTGEEHDQLMKDVEEYRKLDTFGPAFTRRMEIFHAWVTSEKVTDQEWIELMTNGG